MIRVEAERALKAGDGILDLLWRALAEAVPCQYGFPRAVRHVGRRAGLRERIVRRKG